MATGAGTGTPATVSTPNYGSLTGAQALLPTLGTLGSGTTPSTTQVTGWLEEASAIIDRMLTTAGYLVPVASTAAAYPELDGLANIYAAARALQARAIETPNGELVTRWQTMLDEFYARLKSITETALPGATAAAATTGGTARRIRGIQTVRVDRQVDTASEYT